jgi:excisionase family DNA binding protein
MKASSIMKKDESDRSELLTLEEAAERCKVGEKFLRDAIRRRQVRVVILGPRAHRIQVKELERWWDAKQTRGPITL